MRKPRAHKRYGREFAVLWPTSACVWLCDRFIVDLKQARRLHTWLGKAIEWMEWKEKQG